MENIYLQLIDNAYRDILSHIFGADNTMLNTYHALFLVIFLIIFANRGMTFLLRRHHIISKQDNFIYFIFFNCYNRPKSINRSLECVNHYIQRAVNLQ